MNVKELILEVERLSGEINRTKHKGWRGNRAKSFEKLRGIKQTVEAVDKHITLLCFNSLQEKKDWQELKKLLGVN